MDVDQIKKIEELVNFPGKKIVSSKVERLTASGENYGSLMLSVVLSDGVEQIPLIAKTVPPNEFIQEIFNTPVTFRNEIAFYKNIVPLLQAFQRDQGVEKVIDFAPKYYGSRLNLTGSDEVDSDAVLLLENLKVQNYSTLDPTQGVDYDVAKLILTDLALLHAVPLALKLKKPDVFEKEIKPYLDTWMPKQKNHLRLKRAISELTDQIPNVQVFKGRILTCFDKQTVLRTANEPFATITHNDCWVPNNMVKFEDGTPVKNKLVDYQVCCYGSPARDLVFFLFSSVKNDVIMEKYDDLIRWYHDKFIAVLKQLDCKTEPFSYQALEDEMDVEARESEFGHIAFMLLPMFAEKKNVEDISKLTPENITQTEFTDSLKNKFDFVVTQFVRRNWI